MKTADRKAALEPLIFMGKQVYLLPTMDQFGLADGCEACRPGAPAVPQSTPWDAELPMPCLGRRFLRLWEYNTNSGLPVGMPPLFTKAWRRQRRKIMFRRM